MDSVNRFFLFYEPVSGDILQEVEISKDNLYYKDELQKKSDELSEELIINRVDIFRVECVKD